MRKAIGKAVYQEVDARAALASNVKRLMQAAGLTAEQVGAKAGITPRTVRNVVNGEHDTQLTKIAGIAKALKVPVWILLLDESNSELDAIVLAYREASERGRKFLAESADASAHMK